MKEIKETLKNKQGIMTIQNSTIKDIDEIFRLYKIATDFQKTKFEIHWPAFERKLIETEILENRQWKIIIDGQIACVWATTFNDPQIWEERNNDPSVYIHRIATNPAFRGQNLVGKIVIWAKGYAQENGKQFIRMDTVGDNPGLISHYQKCGFDFLGLLKLTNTDGLPPHYHNATVSLFEIALTKKSKVDIIDFSYELQEPIKTLNYEWLEKYFRIENGDVIALSNPKEQIIDKGGFIFYAKLNNEIVGTASLMKKTENEYELGKMAVTARAQGHGIGTILLEHCLEIAKQKGIKTLILYSNKQLESAIHLYLKYGFVETALESGLYERANIKMKKEL